MIQRVEVPSDTNDNGSDDVMLIVRIRGLSLNMIGFISR